MLDSSKARPTAGVAWQLLQAAFPLLFSSHLYSQVWEKIPDSSGKLPALPEQEVPGGFPRRSSSTDTPGAVEEGCSQLSFPRCMENPGSGASGQRKRWPCVLPHTLLLAWAPRCQGLPVRHLQDRTKGCKGGPREVGNKAYRHAFPSQNTQMCQVYSALSMAPVAPATAPLLTPFQHLLAVP